MALCELSFPSAGSSGASSLSVRFFEVHEALSMLFEVAVVALSRSATIDFEEIVGQPARFSIDGGDLGQRSWTGIVHSAALLDVEENGLSTYRVTIVPRPWLMTQRTNHRIFQHQSAPEIAQTLLGEWGVVDHELRLSGRRFPKLEYRVQFGETDLHFLSRILEEAGIHYFFEDGAKMVLCDAPESAKPEGPPLPWMDNPTEANRTAHVSSLTMSTDVRPGKTVLGDYDFRRPDYALGYKFESAAAGEAPLEVYRYTPGLGRIDVDNKPMDTPAADDHSAARIDEHAGYALAEHTLSGARADRRHVSFTSNDIHLAPGKALSIRNHPKPALRSDRHLIVQSIELEGTVDGSWDLAATALFGDMPIRPTPKTPRPIVPGPQSAIVVGPAGEEIHTDEFGRVRVRFHWDRGGEFDDTRTCWLRVADGWAGVGWGMIAIPRVGNEVIVDFYEGSPDEPVIVGRVYSATQPPPYSLPGKRTKTGWKTRSSPSSEGYNELCFEDSLEREMLSIRAEKDLHKAVLNDERETIQRDRTVMVGGNLTTNVKENDSIVAGAMHSVQMGTVTKQDAIADGGQADVAPGETLREMIAGRITIKTGGAEIQLDGPNVIFTAQSDITLKAGGEVRIFGAPYVQINPPVVAKTNTTTKKKAEPKEVVWFKLTSDDGGAIPDMVCHIDHGDGQTSSVQRTDGHGLVRFPAQQTRDYKLMVGAPSPKAKAKQEQAAKQEAQAAKPTTEAKSEAKVQEVKPVEVGSTSAQKTPRAKPTSHAVPIKLDIVSPKPKTAFEIDAGAHPSPDPSMPVVTLEANVLFQGKPVTVGTLTWELSISGKYRVRDRSQAGDHRRQEFTFSAGNTQTTPGQKVDFRLTPGEIVGGDLTVTVTYNSGPELGDLKATAKVKELKVVGKNPAKDDVRALVSEIGGTQTWCLVRMFCHESLHSLGNFKKSDVLYGPPAGVGIVQRDPEPQEWEWPKSPMTQPNNFFPRIFWDWKKNVREGVEAFRSIYIVRARTSLGKLRKKNSELPEPSEEIVLRAAIRSYNGGNEYQASDDGKHYVVSPYLKKKKDGTIVSLAADRLPYVNQVLDDPHTDAAAYPVPADVRAETYPAPAQKKT